MHIAKLLIFSVCYFFILESFRSCWAGGLTVNTPEQDPTVIKLAKKILQQAKHIHVYYDGCEADDTFLKHLIDYNISVNIINKFNFLDYDYVLIITQSVIKLSNSTFIYFKKTMMHYKINIIIYDKGNHNSVYYLNNLSNYFYYANVFYIYYSLFYYLSSPLIPNRSFLKMRSDFWNVKMKLPDMKRSLVRFVTYNNPIYFMIDKSKIRLEDRYNGVELKILLEIAKQFNFSWEVHVVNMKDGWVGIYEEIDRDTADVGFGGLWALQQHSDDSRVYTVPWTKVGMGFLVPRPKLDDRTWMNVLKPFSLDLWLSNIVTLIVAPLILWYLYKLSNNLRNKITKGNILSLASSYLYMFGSFCQVSSQLSSRKETVIRYLFLAWNVFVLMMATAYSSCIIARLTSPSYTTTIDTTKQLVEQGMKWGKLFPVTDFTTQLNLNDKWNKEFATRYKVYKQSEISEMIKSNTFAVYCKLLDTYNVYYTNHLDDEDLRNLRVMKERVITHDLSFVLQNKSPLLQGFNVIITRLFESGITIYLKKHVAGRYSSALNLELFVDGINHDNELTSLSLSNLQGAFYILIFGLSLAVISFLIEITYKSSQVVLVQK